MADKQYIALAAGRSIEGQHASWATARGLSSGTVKTNYGSPDYNLTVGSYLTGGVYHIYRHGMFFDLSNLSAGYAIQAATLRLFVWYKGSAGAIHVVEGVQDNPVNAADYGDLFASAISGGAKTVASMTLDQYNNITLNSSAIGWLTPGQSVVKLALRGGYDIQSAESPGAHQSTIRFYPQQKGTGYEPILLLTVTAQYPSDSLTRVTGIRHIYRPGSYRLEANLGEVSTTVEVVRYTFAREAEFRAYAEAARTIEVPAKTVPELDGALEDEDRRLREASERIKRETAESIKEDDRRLWEANERLKREAEERHAREVEDMLRRAARFRETGGMEPSPREANQCPYCGASFATQTELAAHIRQKHGGM